MSRYRKWVLTLGIVAATPGLAAAGPFSFGQSQNDDAAAAASSPKAKNQKVAEDIAVALKKAAFHGYEIDIEYKDGLAILHGKVSDPRQKARPIRSFPRSPASTASKTSSSWWPTRKGRSTR